VHDDTKIDPRKWKGSYGMNAALYCNSTDYVRWFFKTKTSYPIHAAKTLAIPNIQLKDSGVYYCFGSSQKSKYFISETLISVYSKNHEFIPNKNINITVHYNYIKMK